MAVTSDGAAANRTMYQMHIAMKHTTTANYEERNIVYPHLIKTGRNNLARSGFDKNLFTTVMEWQPIPYLEPH